MPLPQVGKSPAEVPKQRIGRYQILEPLVTPTQGTAYLARVSDTHGPDTLVLLTFVPRELTATPTADRSWLAEATRAALLRHEHIARVLDIGKNGSQYFFTREHVDGLPLSAILRQLRSGGQTLGLDVAVTIVLAVARGLTYARECEQGYGQAPRQLHRDISPANILIGHDGSTKLVDSHLATGTSSRDDQSGHGPLSQGTQTPASDGKHAPVDPAADVLSLRSLLLECITVGRKHETWTNPVLAIGPSQIATPLRLREVVPTLPGGFESILECTRSSDHGERPLSVAHFITKLEAFAAQERIAVGPASVRTFMREAFPSLLPSDLPSSIAPLAPPAARTFTATETNVVAMNWVQQEGCHRPLTTQSGQDNLGPTKKTKSRRLGPILAIACGSLAGASVFGLGAGLGWVYFNGIRSAVEFRHGAQAGSFASVEQPRAASPVPFSRSADQRVHPSAAINRTIEFSAHVPERGNRVPSFARPAEASFAEDIVVIADDVNSAAVQSSSAARAKPSVLSTRSVGREPERSDQKAALSVVDLDAFVPK